MRWVLEGGKFWLSVLTELHNRELRDILIRCCDGLSRLPDAIMHDGTCPVRSRNSSSEVVTLRRDQAPVQTCSYEQPAAR